MQIDVSNAEIINTKDVYIHDDILEDLYFNRNEKKLRLVILTKDGKSNNKRFSIDFLQVIAFEMTSCDFWGSSPRILDFEYVEQDEATIIPKLFKKIYDNDYIYCPLKNEKKYFETIITFISGDTLKIACKSIMMQ